MNEGQMGGNVNLEAPLPGSFSSHIPVGQTDPTHGSEDSHDYDGRGYGKGLGLGFPVRKGTVPVWLL